MAAACVSRGVQRMSLDRVSSGQINLNLPCVHVDHGSPCPVRRGPCRLLCVVTYSRTVHVYSIGGANVVTMDLSGTAGQCTYILSVAPTL